MLKSPLTSVLNKISQANKLSFGLAAVIQLYKNTHRLKFMHFLMSDVLGLFKIQSNQNNRDLKNDFQVLNKKLVISQKTYQIIYYYIFLSP